MTAAYSYIRFSSGKQRTGASVERQTDWARKLCEQRGLALDETLSISDTGVSAFRGKNRTTGGLSMFLAACKKGRVPRGSYLLVESLDRLSREHPLGGFELVKELLSDHGIRILTAFPAQEYSLANFDTAGWLLMAEFQRAHSESLAKSERSKFNWEKRRELADRQVVTTRLPAWLKMEGGKIALDEPKAAVVRRIFDLSTKGFGQQVIAKKLRAEGVPPLVAKGITWYEGTIQRLLSGRVAVGEYQPFALRDGKRTAVGEPVKGYYPAVVSEDVWQASRRAMRARKCLPGRVTAGVTNLLTSLVFEGGVLSAYKQKGGVGYLQRRDKLTPGVRYGPLERAVLGFVRAVEVFDGAERDERTGLERRQAELAAGIDKLRSQIDADPGMADLLPTLSRWRQERAEVAERLEAVAPAAGRHLHTKRLVEALATAQGEELETLRREVRLAVRQVVDRIDVTRKPAGGADRWGVTVGIRLKTGEDHVVYYEAQGGRLLEAVHLHRGKGFEHWDVVAADPPAPRAVAAAGRRERCLALKAEGKTYEQIAEATGLNRVTVYRYLRGDKRKLKRVAGK